MLKRGDGVNRQNRQPTPLTNTSVPQAGGVQWEEKGRAKPTSDPSERFVLGARRFRPSPLQGSWRIRASIPPLSLEPLVGGIRPNLS